MKKFRNDIKSLLARKTALDLAVSAIKTKVQSVCEFEIHLDFVPGDGWCFGADVSGSPLYMKMEIVLHIVEKNGKFTVDDWDPFD